MTATETALLHALLELENTVKSRPPGNARSDLAALLARVDELARAALPEADPDLRHYLQKKSYEKARLWLEGRGAENTRGQCGH